MTDEQKQLAALGDLRHLPALVLFHSQRLRPQMAEVIQMKQQVRDQAGTPEGLALAAKAERLEANITADYANTAGYLSETLCGLFMAMTTPQCVAMVPIHGESGDDDENAS